MQENILHEGILSIYYEILRTFFKAYFYAPFLIVFRMQVISVM